MLHSSHNILFSATSSYVFICMSYPSFLVAPFINLSLFLLSTISFIIFIFTTSLPGSLIVAFLIRHFFYSPSTSFTQTHLHPLRLTSSLSLTFLSYSHILSLPFISPILSQSHGASPSFLTFHLLNSPSLRCFEEAEYRTVT